MIPKKESDSVWVLLLQFNDFLEVVNCVLEIIKIRIPLYRIAICIITKKDYRCLIIFQFLLDWFFPEVSAMHIRNYQYSFHETYFFINLPVFGSLG